MEYDTEFEEFYSVESVDLSLEDDEIDGAEAGFMHGYLGNWRGF
jgi:hypothetical protein